MEGVTNIANLDENKNSSTLDDQHLDNHILESIELSVSPLMSAGENKTPEIAFQSPTSPQGNISEVNSNITVQSPKNVNNITSEMEGGFVKLEFANLHDTSNESILGENVSYKSCNGSFLGDANNSFKSLNGSYVIETTSPSKSVKSLLDETITKIQSPSLQPDVNVSVPETDSNLNHVISFNNEATALLVKEASFTQNMVEAPELLVKEASFTQNKVDGSVQSLLDVTVVMPSPNSYETRQNSTEGTLNYTDSLLFNQSASFLENNLSNDAPVPDQETQDGLSQVLNDSTLDGALAAFSALKLEDAVSAVNCDITAQSPEKVNNIDSEVPLPPIDAEVPPPPIDAEVPPPPIDAEVPPPPIDAEVPPPPIDDEVPPPPIDVEVPFSQSIGTTLGEVKEIHDSSNPLDFTNTVQDSPVSDEVNCKISIQIDCPSAVGKIIKNADSPPFSQLGEPSGDVIPEAFDGALQDDPFGMKSLDFNASPAAGDFIFKVPQTPVDAENEEFADAVQFFRDPSSFSFLESIKTSPPAEGNTPRSSLYIKFDPLHSTFSKNAKSSDVLQALKRESGLDLNAQCLNVSARESLGDILISFDSPRKSSGPDPRTPVMVAPAKLYTEEELHQHLTVNELTNQEMLLKKQREMEEEMARKEKEMMAKIEEKDVTIATLENLARVQSVLLAELVCVSGAATENVKGNVKMAGILEEENTKLKADVKTLTEDLQSVETTFADFHKRYEQCKGMLKTFKDNEEVLKTKLKEVERENQELKESTQEALEKATSDASSIKKSSEAQTAVLKAQLKKAELKISSLESDIKQVKMENSQLGGICDDLMEKVGKS